MALVDSLTVFIVGLLIGGLGIALAARLVTGMTDYRYAVMTALVGAAAWVLASWFLGFIPFLGPLTVFVIWLAVINWRYPGGWIDALLIALLAWISTLMVLYLLAELGFTTLDAIGVPGV